MLSLYYSLRPCFTIATLLNIGAAVQNIPSVSNEIFKFFANANKFNQQMISHYLQKKPQLASTFWN